MKKGFRELEIGDHIIVNPKIGNVGTGTFVVLPPSLPETQKDGTFRDINLVKNHDFTEGTIGVMTAGSNPTLRWIMCCLSIPFRNMREKEAYDALSAPPQLQWDHQRLWFTEGGEIGDVVWKRVWFASSWVNFKFDVAE